MSRRSHISSNGNPNKARIARIRDKALKMKQKVRQSAMASIERRESRKAWWERAFRTPLVGFYGWVRSRCSSMWAAMMTILGLSPKSRLLPRSSSVKRSKSFRQSYTRNMLHAEGLEQRQLLAADLTGFGGSEPGTYSDTGALSTDTALTSVTSITLTGDSTAAAFSPVYFDVDGDNVADGGGTVDGSGNFTSTALTVADGDVVRISEVSNFATVEDAVTVTIDSTPPVAPGISLDDDTGASGTDGVTMDGLVNVSDLELDATWEYSTDSGATWTPGTGASFTLADGTYAIGAILVNQTDEAGNTSVNGSNAAEIVVGQGRQVVHGAVRSNRRKCCSDYHHFKCFGISHRG